MDQSLVQSDFQVRCHDAGDVVEWIETLQSVVTDRNIRAMNEQNRVCSPPFHSVIEGRPQSSPAFGLLFFEYSLQRTEVQSQQRDAALGELTSIFPNVDSEVISSVLQSNGGDMQRAIDALLAISDPSFQAQPQQPAPRRNQSFLPEMISPPFTHPLDVVETAAALPTSTPQDQMLMDEQLALALQDEVTWTILLNLNNLASQSNHFPPALHAACQPE